MPFSFEVEVEEALREAFAACGVEAASIPMGKVPNASGWGFACRLALMQGRGKDGAEQLAEQAAERLRASGRFERVEAVRGYVNVYIEPTRAAGGVIAGILEAGERFGAGETKAERYVVEYSSPNTHKEFHVGHLRNTAFGNAVVRLLRFAGYPVVTDTYIGDMGAHVIRCLWCLRKYHAGEEPPTDRLDWLGKVYAEAVGRIDTEPGAKDEIAELNLRWGHGDVELMELWRQTRQWSIEELERIYRQLDVEFEHWYFESDVEEEGSRLAQELIDRGIAEYSEGLPIVRLPEKLGVLPVRRSDGTSLYSTKELALTLRKFRDHHVDKSIVITSVEQILYFKQVYKTLQLYGFEHAGDCVHLAYERINLPEGKMSSRFGNIITYEDLLEEATERVNRIVAEKNPALPMAERHEAAEQVAIGALKFAMLSVSNTSVIVFEWDRVLDFDGYAGPYLQYAYVRASRILERARGEGLTWGPASGRQASAPAMHEVERQLLETMAEFPAQVTRAVDQRSPVTMATYVHTLAKQFSDFYQGLRVLQEPDAEIRQFRLALTACVRQVLANGLTILGLALPRSM